LYRSELPSCYPGTVTFFCLVKCGIRRAYLYVMELMFGAQFVEEAVLRVLFSDCVTGWTVRGSNRGEVKRFLFFSSSNLSDRHWSTLSLLFSGYRGSFPGINRPEREPNRSPPSSTGFKTK
jgi:hypothetical protein